MKNGQQPATKQDLVDLKRELQETIREAIHESETRLLTAFYAFSESNQMPPAG